MNNNKNFYIAVIVVGVVLLATIALMAAMPGSAEIVYRLVWSG